MRTLAVAFVLAVAVYHVFANAAPQLQPFCPTHAAIRTYQTFGR